MATIVFKETHSVSKKKSEFVKKYKLKQTLLKWGLAVSIVINVILLWSVCG